MLVGYARCSTDAQDLTAQRNALTALGVKPNRIYVDHGLTGTNRAGPGLREALAACRSGDTLVVTKLDRLACSLTDARNIVEELTEGGVKLNIGGSVHDPTGSVGSWTEPPMLSFTPPSVSSSTMLRASVKELASRPSLVTTRVSPDRQAASASHRPGRARLVPVSP